VFVRRDERTQVVELKGVSSLILSLVLMCGCVNSLLAFARQPLFHWRPTQHRTRYPALNSFHRLHRRRGSSTSPPNSYLQPLHRLKLRNDVTARERKD